MENKEYYNKQDNLTAAKIEFYQDYIKGYLPKLLMGFKQCFIADLFCGAGKNGNKQGSPLVLIDKAKYILKIPQLRNSQIYILFNDKEKSNIENLEIELKKIKENKNIIISPIQNNSFEGILPEILKLFRYKDIPIFFFLDPFTYSDVKMKHLKELMSLKFVEVLLFSPIFHSYRFASDKKLKIDHKTREFIEEFTDRGISDYESIDDFMKSIKNRLRKELSLDFVRPILLNNGSRKNSLFLLTKHELGMILMNNLCIKKSRDGSGIDVKENYENKKFLTDKKKILKLTSRYKDFKTSLLAKLQDKKEMTTSEIKKFTIMSEFRPQDASNILKELKKEDKIKFFNTSGKETKKFYMGINPKGNSIFKYIS
jgi:three-Cys-motif partner protein